MVEGINERAPVVVAEVAVVSDKIEHDAAALVVLQAIPAALGAQVLGALRRLPAAGFGCLDSLQERFVMGVHGELFNPSPVPSTLRSEDRTGFFNAFAPRPTPSPALPQCIGEG